MNRKLTLATVIVLCGLVLTGAAGAAGTTPGDITWTTANTDSTGDQDNASVATDRNGYTAVVWEDDRDSTNPGDPLHSDIWIRLYHEGVSQYEKKISAGGTGNWTHVQPDVALHDDGSAVVVWSEDPDGNGVYNIAVRTVSTTGTVAGSGTANADAAGQQSKPAVAADPDSPGFAVAWEDQQGTAAPTVRAAGFTSLTAKGYEAQVNTGGGASQNPDMAMGAVGNAIVVWDNGTDVMRKILTPTGGVQLTQGIVNATTGGIRQHAAVAANFDGDFAVAWQASTALATRTFGKAGNALSTTDAALPAGTDPQVGIDDQRNSVVGWVSTQDVYAKGFNPDGTGTTRLPQLLTDKVTTGRQDEPALAVDAWGEITVAYTDDNDGNGFDQIYLGTGLTNTVW
ncbi:hypothetical protein D5S17_27260 [Pseudonocardiaceae bacterium YIM PH 21723]|nr:hypothetical protein D5S17_27260 [Pseudonocardiaceae bacterium YIM PH 21723]